MRGTWWVAAFVLASACSSAPAPPKKLGECKPNFQPTESNFVLFNGKAVAATTPPPPLAGGTLAIAPRAGFAFVVAGVPDADRIVIARLENGAATKREITLASGADPGRIVDDGTNIHVVLRGSGSVLTLDPQTGSTIAERPVCPTPRGIAVQGASIHVACATGELVTLPIAGGVETRRSWIDRDLRDVVVLKGQLLVSRFRAAEILTIDANGAIAKRLPLSGTPGHTAHVAWRVVERDGRIAISHQLASTDAVDIRKELPSIVAAYGGGAPTPTERTVAPIVVANVLLSTDGATFLRDNVAVRVAPTFDVALGANGVAAAIGLVGDSIRVRTPSGNIDVAALQIPSIVFGRPSIDATSDILAIQTREPASVLVYSGTKQLLTIAIPSMTDTGFDAFHSESSCGVACASCHPEGGDDGHAWTFTIDGPVTVPGGCTPEPTPRVRRTQSVRGGISKTAPLHWDGDQASIAAILDEVFTRRMAGGTVTNAQKPIIQRWIDSIPALPLRVDLDTARVATGKALFEGKGDCARCHSGPMLTNNALADVGTGNLQVPQLVGIGDRAPFLHDGCAKTLLDRFDPKCGGDKHGNALTPDEQGDVVQYLESL